MQSSKAALPQSFIAKKKKILDQLSVPASEYDDLSPKGSIDVEIRDLIDEINQIEGCVTTSSCSGRVSVFLEGKRRFEEESRAEPGEKEGGDGKVVEDQMDVSGDAGEVRGTTAGVGGKGGGGRWLYVSHTEVAVDEHGHVGGLAGLLGMEPLHDDPPRDAARRYIHFKFEPMILHVLTASFEHAQMVLSAALQAGFRESGAINLTSSTKEPPSPIVAVRSMGLALESLVGFHHDGRELCSVSEKDLRTLLEISNERFRVNSERIMRFQALLRQLTSAGAASKRRGDGEEWEDPQERRERKKAEGLRRKQLLKETGGPPPKDPEDISGLEFLE